MDWTQFIIMFLGMIGLFAWNRVEANSDRREAAALRSSDRREILDLIRGIDMEIKDFHGRLERQDAEFKSHIMHCHKE